MSLGSQSEANEIFEYVQRFSAWREFNNGMEYNRQTAERWEYQREMGYIPEDSPLEFYYPYGPELPEPEMPEGWKYLAAGVSRRAYLSPTGVVYKVQKTPGSDYQGNRGEHQTAEYVRSLGNVVGAVIPRTELYEVPGCYVIALEFMDGIRGHDKWDRNCYGTNCRCGFMAGRCARTIRRELENKFGLSDLHSENVLWIPSQRKWAVVDLGLSNRRSENESAESRCNCGWC
ncbi:hypothetical protein SEA_SPARKLEGODDESS_258 [Streptomyces phage SparkleGoddess]|uniref:Uncharacterized protein n=1 Tax=Streptomyces phage SparkleGoddess TaxID=2283305 RepID=A0A345MEF6_9CAUD|nr:hypothetical protein SEA_SPARKLEGODDESS_258 [Streptomyces phage SparkleGoddess]